jgi:hypothetical protein
MTDRYIARHDRIASAAYLMAKARALNRDTTKTTGSALNQRLMPQMPVSLRNKDRDAEKEVFRIQFPHIAFRGPLIFSANSR